MGPHQACIDCCTATIAAVLSQALLLQQCCWPPGPLGPGLCGSCVRFWLWGKMRSSVLFIWLLSCSRSELSSKHGVPEWLFWTWTGGGLPAGYPGAPCAFSQSWVQGWRLLVWFTRFKVSLTHRAQLQLQDPQCLQPLQYEPVTRGSWLSCSWLCSSSFYIASVVTKYVHRFWYLKYTEFQIACVTIGTHVFICDIHNAQYFL